METVKVTNYYSVSRDDNGDKYLTFYDSVDEMLHQCSKQIAFDDCGGVWPDFVVDNGKTWCYMGWQPGMIYQWTRSDGEVWSRQYLEWDH